MIYLLQIGIQTFVSSDSFDVPAASPAGGSAVGPSAPSGSSRGFGVWLSGLLSFSGLQIKNNWWTASFGEILPQGVALDPLNWAPVYTAIMTHLQQVLYKQVTPMQGATALYNQLTQLLAQGGLSLPRPHASSPRT